MLHRESIRRPRYSDQSDAALVELTQEGDTLAFGELWSRHSRAGEAYARSVSSSVEADDVVAEAYIRILQAIRSGKGPTDGRFGSYLYATVRSIAIRLAKAQQGKLTVALDEACLQGEDESARIIERMAARAALRTLPLRWQQSLWLREVVQLSHAETGRVMGIQPSASAVLAARARDGLRAAWNRQSDERGESVSRPTR